MRRNLLTDVAGIYADYPVESSLLSRTDVAGLEAMLASGAADGGMIPKLKSCALALRGGVKDSTAGIGADALLYGGRLKLSADGYGGLTDNTRLKVTAAFAVFRSLYLLGGIDDPFAKPGYLNIEQDSSAVPDEFQRIRYGRDYFIGAGLHFDDDDLATLFRVYGSLLASQL